MLVYLLVLHLSDHQNCSVIFCNLANCFTLLSYSLSKCIMSESKGKLSSLHSLLMYLMAKLQVAGSAVMMADEESAIRICDHVTQLKTKHFQNQGDSCFGNSVDGYLRKQGLGFHDNGNK